MAAQSPRDEIILAQPRSHPETNDLLKNWRYDLGTAVWGVGGWMVEVMLLSIVQRRLFFGIRF
jgi:hypothetical protein